MLRWIKFFIVMALGVAAGLYFGWQLNPSKNVSAAPDALRDDYRADYVLMVAEAYKAEGDIDAALRRLVFLGDDLPAVLVEQAIQYASNTTLPYPANDLALLQALADALARANPALEAP
jgi:hypothetical protein